MISSFLEKILQGTLKIFFGLFFFFHKEIHFSDALSDTISLYSKDGFGSLFARIRAWDAPYDQVEELISSKARVLDLGSGDGLMANFLALAGPQRKVFGIELNKRRAKVADKGVKNTEFRAGDILKSKFPKVDTILLVHVLHHLPSRRDQEILLDKIQKTLKKGDQLIILEIDKKPLSKYIFSFLTDAITVPLLFESKLYSIQFFYRGTKEWKSMLTQRGFRVKTKSAHKGMPFSHILIIAKKK